MLRFATLLSSSLLAAALIVAAAAPSFAQSGEPIKVEVGKTTLLRFAKRPEVIFIANPAIVDIVIEKSGANFLIGRQTGETNMHLLDVNGETIMNVAVVVVPQETRQLTLHRGAHETTFSCAPRCAGVRNPHAAGANVAGANVDLVGDEGDKGPAAAQPDAAATAAAAAAAATAAAAAQQPRNTGPRRPPYAPLSN